MFIKTEKIKIVLALLLIGCKSAETAVIHESKMCPENWVPIDNSNKKLTGKHEAFTVRDLEACAKIANEMNEKFEVTGWAYALKSSKINCQVHFGDTTIEKDTENSQKGWSWCVPVKNENKDDCPTSDWVNPFEDKGVKGTVYCAGGRWKFPDNGFKNDVDEKKCKQFCANQGVKCAGFLHRHSKTNCKGQCHIINHHPTWGERGGSNRCVFGEPTAAKYYFHANPTPGKQTPSNLQNRTHAKYDLLLH
jgi:hypothetical protein